MKIPFRPFKCSLLSLTNNLLNIEFNLLNSSHVTVEILVNLHCQHTTHRKSIEYESRMIPKLRLQLFRKLGTRFSPKDFRLDRKKYKRHRFNKIQSYRCVFLCQWPNLSNYFPFTAQNVKSSFLILSCLGIAFSELSAWLCGSQMCAIGYGDWGFKGRTEGAVWPIPQLNQSQISLVYD